MMPDLIDMYLNLADGKVFRKPWNVPSNLVFSFISHELKVPRGQRQTFPSLGQPCHLALGVLAWGTSRKVRKRCRSVMKSGWLVGTSSLTTVEAALEEALDQWQGEVSGQMTHVSRLPHPPMPNRTPPGAQVEKVEKMVEMDMEGFNVAFAILFLPCKFGAKMNHVLAQLRAKVNFPLTVPLLAVPTQGDVLSFGSAEQDPEQPAAKAALLDEDSLDNISRESIRIQDTIDANPMLSIQARENAFLFLGSPWLNCVPASVLGTPFAIELH